MSKTTKIIAALGVVAGLGVAALPAFTFAETVTGNVDVVVEVQPAIAMTITGNNDDSSHYGTQAGYEAVADPTGDPAAQHWYERSGTDPDYTYTLTEDTSVDPEKTYYAAVESTYNAVDAFNPSSIANKTLDTHPIPGTSVTGTSSSYASLTPFGLVEGDGTNGFRSTITVYTNYNGGYTLSVKDVDSTTSLTHVDSQGNPIPAASGALTAGTAGWNYDTTILAGGTQEAKTAAAITDENVAIDGLSSKTTGGRVAIVDYNVATAGDQATGVYKDTIVYTATTN